MTEIYHDPEEPLLPGEDPNLERAVLQVIGEQWLHETNDFLGGRSPFQMIGTSDEYKLRNLLRTLTTSGIS